MNFHGLKKCVNYICTYKFKTKKINKMRSLIKHQEHQGKALQI